MTNRDGMSSGLSAEDSGNKTFEFRDALYLEARKQTVKRSFDQAFFAFPMNIYELHPPTFKADLTKCNAGSDLVKIADELCTYVKQLGYTHVKPIFTDGEEACLSPYEVKYFVNMMHENGIGVIWSLTALRRFFRITDERKIAAEVTRFVSEYHIDGVCTGKSEAHAVVTEVKKALHTEYPDVTVICEGDPKDMEEKAGDLALGNGWADDILPYFSEDPYFRKHHHKRLTNGAEAGAERQMILSFSHRTVSADKGSLLSWNFGDYNMKFAGFRTLLAYHMTCPGKKLMFMGCEYAPFKAWSKNEPLEWFMLDFDMHRRSRLYTAELNNFYLNEPALWERDFSRDGFEWIYKDLDELNIIAFKRFDAHGDEIAVLINFAPVDREGFVVEGLTHSVYREVFSSDAGRFGGTGRHNGGVIKARYGEDGKYSARITLPGLTALILKPISTGEYR